MNINNYTKEIQDIIIQSGITDRNQVQEITTLSLLKLMQSPAIAENFENYSLEHFNMEGETLGILKNDLFKDHFVVNSDAIVYRKDRDSGDERKTSAVKSDSLKNIELQFLDVLNKSQSFNEFYNNFEDLLSSRNPENQYMKYRSDLMIHSRVENTLMDAYKIVRDIKNDEITGRINLLVEPFAAISGNYKEPALIKLLQMNISQKLDFLNDDDTLFKTLSEIDGVDYVNFSRFKEAYYDNELDEESFLSKLLISDTPSDCIEAVFEGEWYDTYKATTLRSLKKCLLEPTVNDMYELYPIIDTVIEKMYDRYPYFNINQNDVAQIKTILELKETTEEERKENKEKFLDDTNAFTLKKIELDENRIKDVNYTRVYAVSPFEVLMDIGGRHAQINNLDLDILHLENIKMSIRISDENEIICINRFFKLCQDNKIVCAYNGDEMSSRFKEIMKNYEGSVVIFDKGMGDPEDEILNYYKMMLFTMKLNYDEMLIGQKERIHFKSGLSDEDMIKALDSKIKSQNKLTL
jgi:hypothetical protein